MPNFKTLLPIAVAAAVVILFLGMGYLVLDARGDASDWKDKHDALVLSVETSKTTAHRVVRERDAAQRERDNLAERLATQDVVEQEPVIKYVTREVVRYAQSNIDRSTLSGEWVRLYNLSGTGALETTETGSAGAVDASASTVPTDAIGADTRRSGVGYSDTEQLEPPSNRPAVDTLADLGTGVGR